MTAGEVWSRGDLFHVHRGSTFDPAHIGPPPDAGMKARQQAEKPENENGFTKLKPSPATEAPAHLGESRARDERSRHAQSRAYK